MKAHGAPFARRRGARRALAEAEVFAKVAQHRSDAPSEINRLLDSIALRLFDPEPRVWRMRDACGIRDSSVILRFRAAFGSPPSVYVRRSLRMETAPRLPVVEVLSRGV